MKIINAFFKWNAPKYKTQNKQFYSCISPETVVKSFSKMPFGNRLENASHCLVIKCLNAYDIEMAQEPVCNVISAPTRRTHCSQHHNILQIYDTSVLSAEIEEWNLHSTELKDKVLLME